MGCTSCPHHKTCPDAFQSHSHLCGAYAGGWIQKNDGWFDYVVCPCCGNRQKEPTPTCKGCGATVGTGAQPG